MSGARKVHISKESVEKGEEQVIHRVIESSSTEIYISMSVQLAKVKRWRETLLGSAKGSFPLA